MLFSLMSHVVDSSSVSSFFSLQFKIPLVGRLTYFLEATGYKSQNVSYCSFDRFPSMCLWMNLLEKITEMSSFSTPQANGSIFLSPTRRCRKNCQKILSVILQSGWRSIIFESIVRGSRRLVKKFLIIDFESAPIFRRHVVKCTAICLVPIEMCTRSDFWGVMVINYKMRAY